MKYKKTFIAKQSQKGLAAITFVLIFPIMFGLFVLGIEGSRFMLESARLGDAAEVASLAIAANNVNTEGNKQFALDYVNAYSDDAVLTLSDISIVEKTCKQIYGDSCGTPGVYDKDGNQFVEYKVTVNTSYKSFFPGDSYHQGFDVDQPIGAKAVARKFRGDTVDVVFVGDFSGSMGGVWKGEFKYLGVLNVINNISDELDQFNTLDAVAGSDSRSRVAFVGYNNLTSDGDSYNSNLPNLGAWWQYDIPEAINYSSSNIHLESIANLSALTFNNISLTEDMATFKSDISGFTPNGGTSSYEGLVAGANIISEGTNRKKLIFILSDGADNSASTANSLYDGGMCENIRQDLNSKVISGKNVESVIVVIGFGYDIDANPGLQTCAGADNVHSASSYDDIFNTILELIMEEVGHNYYKDYKVD